MKQAWNKFLLSGKVEEGCVRKVIAESWTRCRDHGVKYLDGYYENLLSREETERFIEERKQLIDIARPIMKTLFKCVEGSSFIVVLTNEKSVILEIMGDSDVLERTKTINFLPGASWSEECVGTNAIGTTLVINHPIQISGAEHYCSKHHFWTCSAAPIRDSLGNVIGCLDMSCLIGREHSKDLEMVVAAVRAIENQLHKEETQGQLFTAHKHLTTVLSTISEGIMSVDKDFVITHVNTALAQIVGMLPRDMIGKKVSSILGDCYHIKKVLETGRSCLEEEITIDVLKQQVHCTLKATPIKDQSMQVVGAVMTFREIKQVHQIVNKMTGTQARFYFRDIVGKSHKIQEVIRKAKVAAKSPSTVLLLGESGTGKEVLAQAIHNSSDRRDGPFIAINCAAMPRELIQSELFGYCDGAFTGAKRGGRPGKFELADGGTLLLDEIGDMPLDMQVNLLRVLQEKNVVRVGADKPISIDVRVIAATNKNLSMEVDKGVFRKDLFYRLNVVTITIPPLKERYGDIKLLVEYFLQKMSRKLGKEISEVHPQAIETFNRYHWPGNVRELENVLEYAINMTEDTIITKECLPFYFNEEEKKIEEEDEFFTLAELEEKAIEKALKKFDRNITKVAESLGIARNTLYEKMKKYKIKK
ncbi:MAG: sigma-54-dependent Fis family transcriptional regulator [Clostridiaceae bacterium]|nr:sigma-54-dependent Fis family transcriptional regulator [Clostridiaceae bacterium]